MGPRGLSRQYQKRRDGLFVTRTSFPQGKSRAFPRLDRLRYWLLNPGRHGLRVAVDIFTSTNLLQPCVLPV